jgi:uncharacterized membrane protein YciS (DUF1049 family)
MAFYIKIFKNENDIPIFNYLEASDIFPIHKLDGKYLIVGIICGVVGIVVGYIQYSKKDITI